MRSVSVLDKVIPFHYIYFVRAHNTGLTKIGRTKNLGQRVAQLSSTRGPLTLLCCIPTFDPYLETQIHRLLIVHRVEMTVEKEWFAINDEMLFTIIKEILRGFRNWSEAPVQRIKRASFIAVKQGDIVPAKPRWVVTEEMRKSQHRKKTSLAIVSKWRDARVIRSERQIFEILREEGGA